MMTYQHSCELGWVCEKHPDKAWPTHDCGGAGKPCRHPKCTFGQSANGVIPTDDEWQMYVQEHYVTGEGVYLP